MKGSAYYVKLLFSGQFDKIDGIARYSYSKLGIQFRMFHSVFKSFFVQNVYVNMMSALVKISVQKSCKVFGAFTF